MSISKKTSIINFLLLLIAQDSSTENASSLRNDTLACLMVLAEDNEDLAQTFVASDTSEGAEKLMQLKDSAEAQGILACGVLHNIFATINSSKQLSKTVQVDDSVLVPTLSKVISTINPSDPATPGGGWSNPFEYQTLALEVLADIGTSINAQNAEPTPKPRPNRTNGTSGNKEDEDGAEDMEEDEEDEEGKEDGDMDDEDQEDQDDEMDQDELEADMDLVTGADQPEDSIDDLPTLKSLLQLALPELLRIASPQPEKGSLLPLQEPALAALNNISWSVSIFDFSDASNHAIKNAWSPAAHAIWQKVITPILASDTADIALATQVTSLAWAIARTLGSETPFQPDEPNKFMTLYQATSSSGEGDGDLDEDPFQALGVKCVGLLGQLALDPAPIPLNREISTFLLTQVSKLPNTPPAVVVEALNQLFDIYGDEEKPCDEVFWHDNFLKHLMEIQPSVRSMAKSVDKKKHAELRLRADEVVLNLTRFLAYKKKHQPSK